MIRVEVLRTLSKLESLIPMWDFLLKKSSQRTLFLTSDWLSTWIKVYLGDHRFLVLAVYRDQSLIGIGPFWVARRRYYNMFSLRELRILGTGEICPDQIDLILDEEYAQEAALAIWRNLWGPLRREWDVFRMEDIESSSTALAAFRKMAGDEPRCAGAEISNITICPYIPLTAGFQTLMADLGSKTRYNINRSRRLLETKGILHFDQCTKEEERPQFMTVLMDMHQKTWQARGFPGTFSRPTFQQFHDEISRKLLAEGRLALYILRLDETPLASSYGFEYNGVHYGYLMGTNINIDPKVSIVHLMLAFLVEEAITHNCLEFNLLRGEEPYKYHWTKWERRDLTMLFFQKSPLSLAYRTLRWLKKIIRGRSKEG